MDVDHFTATQTALRIPELLTSVLRCLGPLEWIKCASVCPAWRDTILGGGDDQAKQHRPEEAAAAAASATTTPVASASPVVLPSTGRAMSTAGAEGVTTTPSEEGAGEGETTVTVAVAAARVATADLWCEFAVSAMQYRDPCATAHIGDNNGEGNINTNSSSACCSGRIHRRHHHHTTGVTRCRGRASPCSHRTFAPREFYRNVCLEGDPIVLGPPLRATAARIGGKTAGRGEVSVAKVSLTDVAAASAARCRHPRAFTEFLLQWNRHRYCRATAVTKIKSFRNYLQFTHHSLLCEKKKGAKGGSSASSSSCSSSMSGRGKAASPSSKCCATTTAMLNEALSVFTRLFVLCRRCRRPQTALFATEDNGARPFSAPRSGGSSSAYNGGGKSPAILAPSLAPSGSPRYEGWGVTLWVECQGEGCGLTSRVGGSGAAGSGGSGGTGPSPWLVKFSRYVLRRGWKDINTLDEDHGTEWFSDTSPAGVRRRQDEARASSIGLEALARRGSGGDGDRRGGDGGDIASGNSQSSSSSDGD